MTKAKRDAFHTFKSHYLEGQWFLDRVGNLYIVPATYASCQPILGPGDDDDRILEALEASRAANDGEVTESVMLDWDLLPIGPDVRRFSEQRGYFYI